MIRRLARRLARRILQVGGNLLAWSLAKEIERAQQQLRAREVSARQQHLANCPSCRSLVAHSVFGGGRDPVARC